MVGQLVVLALPGRATGRSTKRLPLARNVGRERRGSRSTVGPREKGQPARRAGGVPCQTTRSGSRSRYGPRSDPARPLTPLHARFLSKPVSGLPRAAKTRSGAVGRDASTLGDDAIRGRGGCVC